MSFFVFVFVCLFVVVVVCLPVWSCKWRLSQCRRFLFVRCSCRLFGCLEL